MEFLILDNLSTLCGSLKENEGDSWTPVQTWLLSLRKRGVSVLLIHHAGKGGNQSCPTAESSGTSKSTAVPAMPDTPTPLLSQDEIDERIAIMVHDGGIPEPWAVGFARLQTMTPPTSILEARWLQVLDDSG